MASAKLRWLKRIALALLALLLVLQVVPYGREHTNPPVTGEPRWDSPRTRELFMRVCGDCHSHASRWPWYAHVAPASWLVQKDVLKGREHFNVSTFDQGPGDADDAAHEYEERAMPPWFYLPLHSEARLGEADRATLLAGLRATFGGEDER
jgi:hypothetical protein